MKQILAMNKIPSISFNEILNWPLQKSHNVIRSKSDVFKGFELTNFALYNIKYS